MKNLPIAFKLAKTSVATAILVGTLLSSLQVYRDYLDEEAHLELTIQTILKSSERSAIASVYTLSKNLANEVVTGLHEYPFIQEARISDDLGITLADVIRQHIPQSNTRWLTRFLKQEFKTYSVDLYPTNISLEKPGKLVIVVDRDTALSSFFSRSIIVLISGIVGNTLLVLILFVAFHFIITRPLIKLAADFRNIKPNVTHHKPIAVPAGHENDEFSDLTHSANTLIDEKHQFIKTLNKQNEQLKQSESRFRALYHDNPSMFFTLNSHGIILSTNNYGAEQFGYIANTLIGTSVFDMFHQEDKNTAVQLIKSCIAEPESIHRWDIRKLRKDGSILWVREAARVVTDSTGETSILIVCEDITEAHTLSTELSFQASHDALTGLANRREFTHRAEQLLSTLKRKPSTHALCFLDLDQFKIINDTCGHTAGDEMLRQLSKVIQSCVREHDTLARLGGDEFGLLIENCSIKDAYNVALSILSLIQNHQFLWDKHHFKVSASIGLVPINSSTTNLAELLSSADAACYIAKDKGRNQIYVHNTQNTEITQRHDEMRWVTRITQALQNNQFCLYAQPIVSLNNQLDLHYELLIRMIDDEGKIIPPDEFLPAAERYNLIVNIDLWVIENAFQLLLSHPKFLDSINFCSINLSGPSIGNPQILAFITEQLDKLNTSNEKICFEITETAAISNLSAAINFMTTLKALGCQFALDDFGSGLSSFAYLKNLPVDYLKIDGMFVKDIVDDPIAHAMVKSINEIGHVMGMRTIAEYVENDAIKSKLKKMHVDYAQGYGIDKPQRFDDIFKVFQSKKA